MIGDPNSAFKAALHRSPLGETLDALRRDGGLDHVAFEVGQPMGDRWMPMDDVSGIDAVVAEQLGRGGAGGDYAGAALSGALAAAAVAVGWLPVLAARRLPDLSGANIILHRHTDEAWFDAIAVRSPRVCVLPDDRAAGHPEATTVPTIEDLHRLLAGQLVDLLQPWFVALRARTPFGSAGMWGQLADDVCGTGLWTARRLGIDQRVAWSDGRAVVDIVATRVPTLRARPRPFPVRWRGGDAWFQVKGTCCLWYKTHADRDPNGDGYCTSCPLRDDEVRRGRLVTWLEGTAAG